MENLFDHYLIDKCGNIYSKISKTYLSPNRNNSGYLKLNLKVNTELKCLSIHRLVAYVYLGLDLDDSKLVVDHINGDKVDNRVENLRVTTHVGNSKAYFGRLETDSLVALLCYRCKSIKPIDEFGFSKKTSTGRQSRCKTCVLNYNRARRNGEYRATI